MGFDFGKFAQGVADGMQKKYDDLEKKARRDIQSKVRDYSDAELEYLLNKNQNEGRYLAVEEIEKELERRNRY
ncbi:MAG: hypothetical protein PUC12_02755 [Clostridiales bacterium]|nr:hypothetical protein [Clostridiales bacterium]